MTAQFLTFPDLCRELAKGLHKMVPGFPGGKSQEKRQQKPLSLINRAWKSCPVMSTVRGILRSALFIVGGKGWHRVTATVGQPVAICSAALRCS